ncbi:MAG: hypothetical protein M9895_00115 [Aquamicrobium sp.]|uniref:hypothetical protein n=1 Tax=Aquamicrobium sp. TaxID=1872579 RepID=UPI00349E8AC5|nr:hypothetical protein [Aquamicrobium sp.]
MPRARSMAAIKRASMTATRARLKSRSISAKEHAALRAYQYALAMTGNECPHSISLHHKAIGCVTLDINSEGRSVPRRVDLGGAIPFEIPNWDFVPDEPVETVARPAYRAPAHLYSSAWQMAA